MNLDTLPSAPKTQPSYVPIVVAAITMFALIAGGYGALSGIRVQHPAGSESEEQSLLQDEHLDYTQWENKLGRPNVAIVLSGQMHGHYDPCGCSDPQHGGLTRRYNFIKSLKDKKWEVVGVDLGELPSLEGIRQQELLKFGMSVRSLAAMDYRAFGIGVREMALDLTTWLPEINDPKNPFPRPLNISLERAKVGGQYFQFNARQFEVIGHTNPRIGVISMMGPDLRKTINEVDPREKFAMNMKELPKALDVFATAGVEVGIIIHHEYPNLDKKKFPPRSIEESKEVDRIRMKQAQECAEICAKERKKNPKVPLIQLMMIVSWSDLADMFPIQLKGVPTQVIKLGEKGKYVGLVGIFPKDKNGEFQVRYDLVLMSPEWKTKPGLEKNNPVTKLITEDNEKLKAADMLAQFPRSPHFNQLQEKGKNGLKATYVGSEKCGNCHDHAYAVWKNAAVPDPKEKHKLAHARATVTLEAERAPFGRHYDPECMQCHTTGFKHPGG